MTGLAWLLRRAVVLPALMVSMSAPALALGNCGPNRHRDPAGYCVHGGQNED